MVIVLIHWRIKPTDAAVSEFREWWKNVATIKDKTALAGEFLSAPLAAERFEFAVDDLSPQAGDAQYRAFINVGIWRDWESFYKEVGHNFRDDKPPLAFEAERRRRTILEPVESRIGSWSLPAEGTCQ